MTTSNPTRPSRAFVPYPFTATRHAARLPGLVGDEETGVHRVLIVGAGPVGLATALGLANHGVASVVLEADDSVCTGSRAICISRRSLEIIDQLGALPAFLNTGLPWLGGRSFYRNDEVLRFQMPHDTAQRLPPMINIQQYYIEQFLLDACKTRRGLIDIRWQSRVSAIQPDAAGASIQVLTPSGEYRCRTQWLIGCDGARSIVRDAAGLKLEGTSYEGRYVIADIALKSERPVERLAWFDPPSNPGSTILMHRQPDDIWRIDYQLRDDEDPEEAVRPDNVIPRIESHLQMMGEREDWSPIWISLYKANALTLNRYRQGRCLLAGDAAHLVPIFGVRGANSGFEDAHNLAWKLALVVSGQAGDALLDTYSEERVKAARENLSAGIKSTEFMSPPNFAFQWMRTAALSLAVKHQWIRSLINPRQTQASAYAGPPQPVLRRAATEFQDGPAPGAALIDLPLMIWDGRNSRAGHLTQLLHPGFTLLYFTHAELPLSLTAPLADWSKRHVPVRIVPLFVKVRSSNAGPSGTDISGNLWRAYDAQVGSAYLIRPDGHVLARWHRATNDDIKHAMEWILHHE